MPDSPGYTLELSKEAEDDLTHINKKDAERIVTKMRWVAKNVKEVSHYALKGEWAGYYRWHIGAYRAIYILDHEGRILLVAVVGHRREVYDE